MAQRQPKPKGIPSTQFEQDLLDDIGQFYDDPIGYVMYAFTWGEGELADFDGPDEWQAEQLIRIANKFREDPETTIREATASGHGIGKGTETAWIILWAMSTRPHLNGVITANTTTQLTTKTWRELALWHKRAINGHWFDWSATSFKHVDHPETWFCSAIPNSEHNSEAFAGLHAQHVLLIFDEASAIPDVIWEVAEGAMTTAKAMWFVYGNPTKNTGRFRSCFAEDGHRWEHHQIDSRTCKMTNKKEIKEWEEAYGEDSDFFRVRVKGQFPRAGNMQFISSEWVDKCRNGEIPAEAWNLQPIVMGVDVARYGDDKTVIAVRQGRKLHELRKYREKNTMEVASLVVAAIKEWKKTSQLAAVFVDEIGIGAGVVDRLRMLGHDIIGVNAGSKPSDDKTYYNKRIEMWDRMRKWLRDGADITKDDPDLRISLIGIEYGFDDKERMRLERKKDMKKRGLDSPDEGDAIGFTFAEDVGDFQLTHFEPQEGFEPGDEDNG